MTHPAYDFTPYWQTRQHNQFNMAAILGVIHGAPDELPLVQRASLTLPALLVPGDKTSEGQLIAAVAVPWYDILDTLAKDPEAAYHIHWRQWEEIIAGAYHKQGFEVVLTPRSNDQGRDVIATHHRLGSIRFYDQVKAYSPGHLVSAEQVMAMLGVLSAHPNVSKAVITTTSGFAPGVLKDPSIAAFLPYWLELKDGVALLEWLAALGRPPEEGPR